VIVVAEDDDIGILASLELLDPFEAIENRLPVRFLRAALIEGRADGGHMAARDAGRDACH
jgi:hypothetical protein